MFFAKHQKFAASAVLAMWFLAFCAVPALHLLDHRDDHLHLPNGGIVHAGEHSHAHAPAAADFSAEPSIAAAHDSTPAALLGFEHGGGLAHLSATSADTAPALDLYGPPTLRAAIAAADASSFALQFLSSRRSRAPPSFAV